MKTDFVVSGFVFGGLWGILLARWGIYFPTMLFFACLVMGNGLFIVLYMLYQMCLRRKS